MLVLGIALFIFDFSGMTGFVVSESNYSNVSGVSGEITREMALMSINNSQGIVAEMKANNFSTSYIEDKIIEAKLVLQQVDYAMILKNSSYGYADKQAAEMALKLVNWRNLSYGDVTVIGDEIRARRAKAFEIVDSFTLIEVSIDRYQKKGVNNSEALTFLNSAKDAFYQERYSDAEFLIRSARDSIDVHSADVSMLNSLKNATLNFFQKYWIYIILGLAVLALVFYFSFKRIQKIILRNKIQKMKAEIEVLDDLMKRAQTERFKDNKISGLTYNIRMKKYQERLENINQNLPVLQKRLANS